MLSQTIIQYHVTVTLEGCSLSDIERVVALAAALVREVPDDAPVLSNRDQHGSWTELTLALAAPDPVAAVAIPTRIIYRAIAGLPSATIVGIEADPVS